jgi:hypothetical protein
VLPAAALGHLPGPVRIALVGVAIGLAAISQRFVEEPIRHGRIVGVNPPRVLAAAGALTLMVVVSATLLSSRSAAALQPVGPAVGGDVNDVPLPTTIGPRSSISALPTLAPGPVPGDLAPSLAVAEEDIPVIYDDGCHANPAAAEPADGCVFGDRTSSVVVAVFGDSHAAQWFPALERLAEERHWRLLSLTKSACASADVQVWSELFNRPYTECMAWRQAVFRLLANVRPQLVVVSNDRHYKLTINGTMARSEDHEDVWSAGLAGTIQRLRALGSEVVVIGDTVRQTIDPPVCLSEHVDDASACSTPYAKAAAVAREAQERAVSADAGATFIDPTPWMCYTDPCPSIMGRLLIYRDTHHLTATYSRALASRLGDALPTLP